MKNSMLGNFRKATSGLAEIAVTCIKLVVEEFLESYRICVSTVLLWWLGVHKLVVFFLEPKLCANRDVLIISIQPCMIGLPMQYLGDARLHTCVGY